MPADFGSVKLHTAQCGALSDLGDTQEPPQRALRKASLLIAVLTTVSRIAGLIRDEVIASVFGASGTADAFFIAFRIPNFFRRLFGEGAFAAGFVPVLIAFRGKGTRAQVRDLIAHIAGALGASLLLLTLLGVAGAHWLALLFAPGFAGDPVRAQLTGRLLALMFPYVMFISLIQTE